MSQVRTQKYLPFALVAVICVAAVIRVALFRPPSEWAAIKPGVTREEVERIVPKFDAAYGGTKADFKYKRGKPFTWCLAVSWDRGRVHDVEMSLWTDWPERRRLRSIVLQ